MFWAQEELEPTDHDKLLLAQHAPSDVQSVTRILAQLRQAVDAYDNAEIEALLHEAIPDFGHTSDISRTNIVHINNGRNG